MINIGELKHRILIKSLTRAQNDFGEFTETFNIVCKPFAKVKMKGGGTNEGAHIEQSIITAKFTIRFNKIVKAYTPDMFIEYDGKQWEILDVVDEKGGKAFLLITAKIRI